MSDLTKYQNNGRPTLWPEDNLPENAVGCINCELCKQRSRIIWGEGNPQGKIIVILDNPGCREDKAGTPYVCGTRETLQLAAYTVGLNQSDLYITYILKCKPKKAYNKEAARERCVGYLEQQLLANCYGVAFCLGDTAVKSFFNNPGQSIMNARNSWHQIRGLPTYVSYHPLAVRRRPNLYNNFIKDWGAVKKYVDEF